MWSNIKIATTCTDRDRLCLLVNAHCRCFSHQTGFCGCISCGCSWREPGTSVFMSGFMGLFLQLLNDSKGKCGSSGERQKKKIQSASLSAVLQLLGVCRRLAVFECAPTAGAPPSGRICCRVCLERWRDMMWEWQEEGTRANEGWINIQQCVDGDANSLCLTLSENKAKPCPHIRDGSGTSRLCGASF